MPHPIPQQKILSRILRYIINRQISNRPTTLLQTAKTIGIGANSIKRYLEVSHIDYVLICHFNKTSAAMTEILIRDIPNEWLEEISLRKVRYQYVLTGISGKAIRNSFKSIIGKAKIREVSPVGESEIFEEDVDYYFPYRINDRQFEILKDRLISFPELCRIAVEQGYTCSAIIRAVGGYKMLYNFPSPIWRPYIYRGDRFYSREVLKVLDESDKTYASLLTGMKTKIRRQKKMGTHKGKQYPDTLENYLIR